MTFGSLTSEFQFSPPSANTRSFGTAGASFSQVFANFLSSGTGITLTIQYGGTTFANLTSATTLTPVTPGDRYLGSAALPWGGVYTNILSSGTTTTLFIQYGGSAFANLTSASLLVPAAAGKSLGAVAAATTWAGVYTNILSSATTTTLAIQYGGATFANLTSSTVLTPPSANSVSLGSVALSWAGVYTNVVKSQTGVSLLVSSGSSATVWLFSTTGELAPNTTGVLDVGTSSARIRRLETKHAPRVEGSDGFSFTLPEFYLPGQTVLTASATDMWRFIRDTTTAWVQVTVGFKLPVRVCFTGLSLECDADVGVETAQTWTFTVTANLAIHCSGTITWTPSDWDTRSLSFTTYTTDSVAPNEEIKLTIQKNTVGNNFRDITARLHCQPGRYLA